MKKSISLSDYKDAMVKTCVEEMNKVFDVQERDYGRQFALELKTSFLAGYIGSLVYLALDEQSRLNDLGETTEDKAIEDMDTLKASIQNAIAAGFQGAVTTWTGHQTDYYCQIKLISYPSDKESLC